MILKRPPKQLSQEVLLKYGAGDGTAIKIDSSGSISPILETVIKFYYHDYLKFIYEVGKGRVLSQQLTYFMNKIHPLKINERTARDIINEMVKFGLLKKSAGWGNTFLSLTKPSMQFFGGSLRMQDDISSKKRMAFFVEHQNLFYESKREQFLQFIESNDFMVGENVLDQVLKANNIHFQTASYRKTENKNEIILTFAIFTDEYTDIKMLANKVKLINDNLNPDNSNLYYKVNVCGYNLGITNVLKQKWDERVITTNIYYQEEDESELVGDKPKGIAKELKKIRIKSPKLKDIVFTNLNIEQYFVSSREKPRKETRGQA